MPALLWELRDLLHLQTRDVTGLTLEQRLREPAFVDRRYIRARAEPVSPVGGLVALFGSLAPRGAILKRSAATPSLFEIEARAVVFDGLEDLANRIDDPTLDVTEHDILVLKNAGSLTPAGMPEAGYLPIPQKLARAGVKDMVRMSDCRMSGTAFGTIVLHITPEAAAGGPLGLVESGDRIRLSVQRVGWICWWMQRHWSGVAPCGVRQRGRRADGIGSSPTRCCRLTKVAIWSIASSRIDWFSHSILSPGLWMTSVRKLVERLRKIGVAAGRLDVDLKDGLAAQTGRGSAAGG